MSFRYLFGPVTTGFTQQTLARQRQAGCCIAFDETGAADLAITPTDSWDDVCRRLPADWRPDFIVLNLAYTSIPPCLWSAPIPRIGLAADWTLCWHGCRRWGRACELLLTDTAGVERFHQEGLRHARAANLFGYPTDLVAAPTPDVPRDIDILFVGNLHEAVQRERLPWLTRLARLANHRRVVLATGIVGDDYRALLARARIVFNHAIRGECNRRVFEAAAGGALLFQEAANREVPAYFQDGQECVYYTADNLESLLEHYLDHEAERQRIAAAAQARLPQFTFAQLWDGHLGLIEQEWPNLQDRLRQRPEGNPHNDLLARTWQRLSSATGTDPHLARDLAAALVHRPTAAELHNALGLITAIAAGQAPPPTPVLEQVAGYFQRAWACDSRHVVAGLNLAEALVQLRRFPQAAQQVRRVLDVLDRQPALPPVNRDAGHYPLGFDHFRVEWERAAWTHAGQPAAEAQAKRTLLRWRLHALLAEITGDVSHYYEAALARPDLPLTQAALGCALGRQGRPAEAIAHLEQAVAAQPLDLAAARALAQALGDVGDAPNQRRLARDRQLLSRAAPSLVPPEPWFAEAPSVGDELASIIILCCNQLPYTRLCLESVLRHSRPPFELVLVDNGSTDDTPAYLNDLASHPGPARVYVIRNETNRGFPAGCNQALAHARGRYLIFLNNDTIVTEGWLEGLIGACLGAWPSIGLVGPMSNYAIPPQQIPVEYTDPEGLAAFAAHRRRASVGRVVAVERLSGFCFLARREVFERVGGFDERFGLGFFDDDDLGLRVRAAGLRLAVAQEVFVHHFGSRTFLGLGIDCRQQLQQNFEHFRAKWGPEHTAGYRLPEPVPDHLVPAAEPLPPTAPATRPALTVSLCMIVKNEEANLPACLQSIADLVNEVIVVDTGSTDRTREIAQQLGARVFEFAWVDSFAAARNETLRHATGQWIFWMDADDRLDEANRQKLRRLFASLGEDNTAYAMKCVCLPDPETQTATVVDHIRLFRNHPDIRWQYRVHEQILPAIRKLGGRACATDIVIHHVGYQDPALRQKKQQRDFRLLQLDHAEQPDEPFTLFNLGWSYEEMGRPAEALPLLRRSLERSHPGDSIVRKLFTLIMECHRQMGQRAEALAVCQEGRRYYPNDAQLLFQEAALRRDSGDLTGAEACLLQLIGTEEEPHFASVAEGLRTFRARHLLGVIYQEQSRLAEAEAQWRAALQENPQFTPAREALKALLAAQNRLAEWTE
jgi:GT2 family glycosyltransferase/Tfp pilus assembly protein PilF